MILQDMFKTVPGLFSSGLMPELSETAQASIITSVQVDPELMRRALGPFTAITPDDLRRLGIDRFAPKDFRL